MRRVALLILVACSSPSIPHGTTVSPPPAVKPPALRLPGDVRPTEYTLDQTIDPEKPRASGVVTIAAEVVRPTRVVWLNATDLQISRATLGDAPAKVLPGGDDFIGLEAARELPVGPVRIEIAYSAPIDQEKSRGIYAEHENGVAYAYTFFEPIDARRAFPCFDEPSYKVPWRLVFHVPTGQVALGNAAVAKETAEGAMTRVELEKSKPLPSYLVAYIVGPFELVDGGKIGRAATPLRFAIPKGRAGELGYAKEVTPKVVAALEDYFDMDYPFGKLDVAVVPRFWGTMEHPGIVAMGQPLTLIRPDGLTRQRKQDYTRILAHELAHYWFGDVVTMRWWDDTWLNEALGEWVDAIITTAVEPSWRLHDDRIGLSTRSMEADETRSSHAIRQPVETKEAIEASFDNDITYGKGSAIFRMFEAADPKKFQAFIRKYIHAHEWGNASADDLFAVAKEVLGPDVEAAMRSFVEQPGVPRVSGKVDCLTVEPAMMSLEQTRALPAGTVDPTVRTWKTPVCVRYGTATESKSACTLVDGAHGKLELLVNGSSARAHEGAGRQEPVYGCPTWIIPNQGGNGYYRSTVDPKIARELFGRGKLASVAKPTAAEKMMMVADLRAAVDRGEVPIDQVLELVPLIAAESDEKVAVWAFAAGAFEARALDDAMFAKAKRYWRATYGTAAKRLGWTRAKTDSDERHELRRTFVPAVATLDPALEKQARTLADRWLADRNGVEDDLVDAVLSTAAEHGDAALFDRVLAAAPKGRDRREQTRILGSLGAFQDPALGKRARELVLDKTRDLRDVLGILYGQLFMRETHAATLDFVETNLDALLARMRDDESAWFLSAIAGSTCRADELARTAGLVKPRAATRGGAELAVTRALEQSQQCIDRAARQLPALQRVFAKY